MSKHISACREASFPYLRSMECHRWTPSCRRYTTVILNSTIPVTVRHACDNCMPTHRLSSRETHRLIAMHRITAVTMFHHTRSYKFCTCHAIEVRRFFISHAATLVGSSCAHHLPSQLHDDPNNRFPPDEAPVLADAVARLRLTLRQPAPLLLQIAHHFC